MFDKTRSGSALLAIIIASSVIWAANIMRLSFRATAGDAQNSSPAPRPQPETNDAALAVSPCAGALAQRIVCPAANRRALDIINASRLEAITVVQDVRTGALVAFAASRPSSLDVTTPLLPLSVSKLLLAASWWDNQQPDSSFISTRGTANARNPAYRSRVSVHEMLVGGSDSAGMQMAIALRRSVGTERVLADFSRFGFGQRPNSPRDDTFWAEIAPAWRARLTPAPAHFSLTNETTDAEWGNVLSIGESNLTVTGLHISRFLQAVGNNGIMLSPIALEEQPTPSGRDSSVSHSQSRNPIRVMQESTALRLQSAMRDTAQRGTARSIANALDGTGWQIGGKTGTGPGPMPIGPQSDGWFAGLIFNPQGSARFTVATFVRRGGLGGGNAARISAELARYIIGENSAAAR